MSDSRLNAIVNGKLRKFRYKLGDRLSLTIISGYDYLLGCYLLVLTLHFTELNQDLAYEAH